MYRPKTIKEYLEKVDRPMRRLKTNLTPEEEEEERTYSDARQQSSKNQAR